MSEKERGEKVWRRNKMRRESKHTHAHVPALNDANAARSLDGAGTPALLLLTHVVLHNK